MSGLYGFPAAGVPTSQNFLDLEPLFAIKSAETTASNSTFANDADLHVAYAANTTYAVETVFFVTGAGSATLGDFSMRWTFGANATMYWGGLGLVAAVAYGNSTSGNVETIPRFDASSPGSTFNFGTPSTNYSTIIGRGLLTTGASTGTLQLQWAQRVTTATVTKLRENSYMMLRKLK